MKKIILYFFILLYLSLYGNVNWYMCDQAMIDNSAKINTTLSLNKMNECIKMEVRIGCSWFRYIEITPECWWKYYFLDWYVDKDDINKKFLKIYENDKFSWENHITDKSWKWEKTLVDKYNTNEYILYWMI